MFIKKSTLMIILFLSFVLSQEQLAVVTKTIGPSEVISDKGSVKKIKRGQILYIGDRIITKKGSFISLIYIDDKSVLKIKENSDLTLNGQKNSNSILKRVDFVNGTIRVKISKRKSNNFIIASSVSVASVKGTDFWFLTNSQSGQDFIYGIEGLVQLQNKKSGLSIDIGGGITGLSTLDGNIQSIKTDAKSIPKDLEKEEQNSETLKIEFIDSSGKRKALVIKYK